MVGIMFESYDRVRVESEGEQTFASSDLEPILEGNILIATVRLKPTQVLSLTRNLIEQMVSRERSQKCERGNWF